MVKEAEGLGLGQHSENAILSFFAFCSSFFNLSIGVLCMNGHSRLHVCEGALTSSCCV